MLNYTGNTVYLDVHKDAFMSDVTIYVKSWSDRSGVFNHAGVLRMAAMIYWPDFGGYIWHVVTDVAVSDYGLYQEVLGTRRVLGVAACRNLSARHPVSGLRTCCWTL